MRFSPPRAPAATHFCALLFAALLCAAAPTAAAASDRFAVSARARQLIVVSSPTYDPPGYIATFRAYARTGPRAPWRSVFGAWAAETGSGHLHDVRHEGDHSTPTGVYAIGPTMYGNDPQPAGLHYAYHRLVCGDWWDEDPDSPRYNRFVHVPCRVTPGFAAWSEPLWTETVAYPYFAVIQFNTHPIVIGAGAPGSGIFLHSWVGGPTEGCVALPTARLLAVLRWMNPAAHPQVAIGTDRELAGLPGIPGRA